MYNLVIIGAGAVGLALGHYFQIRRGWKCLIVEQEPDYGLGISSRNSEVLHAGIYYPSGSLKAQLCLQGAEILYQYLELNGLPHRRCGKYILAAEGSEERLQQLHDQGRANGVLELQLLQAGALRKIYPELAPLAALHSPGTGVLSADGLMHHLLGEFRAADGDLALNTAFGGLEGRAGHFELNMVDASSGGTNALAAERVINSAGLGALEVARLAGFGYDAAGYELRLCKGSYFSVPGARGKFGHLIYPLPTDAGLGIHLRVDLQGEVRLGPDTEYLSGNTPHYSVDAARAAEFKSAVAQYWPGIAEFAIEPDWAGVRPHLYVEGEHHRDFFIRNESAKGADGWINLFGIDSPGLTAAMAFGPYIARLWGLPDDGSG